MIHMKLVTLEEIREINKKNEGFVMGDSSVETALEMGEGKNLYRQLGLIWRAILVYHLFGDGNKRTAFAVTMLMMKRSGIGLNDSGIARVENQMLKVEMKNIDDVRKLERMVKYAIEGN